MAAGAKRSPDESRDTYLKTKTPRNKPGGLINMAAGAKRSPDESRDTYLKTKTPRNKPEGLINMAATYSPAFWCSTIGHKGLNFSVRYGKR
jgi:hypothetical protein